MQNEIPNITIIVPAYNEEENIRGCLNSFVEQTVQPSKLIVVDDGSTDNTFAIIQEFANAYPWIEGIKQSSQAIHLPGKKVILAFNFGLKKIDISQVDFIGKFDADLILPTNYFENMISLFSSDNRVGLAGGNLYIKKDGQWKLESLANKDHIRGGVKLYRKECFIDIGGLKNSIGWDTVDELLAQYHGWKVKTDGSLHVKHLKPTGAVYAATARYKQGEAFYKLRYGFLLTLIASVKLSVKRRSIRLFINTLQGYVMAKREKLPFLVSEEEGVFIRKLRWQGVKKKFFG